jgi:hypothetical protein
VSEKLFRAARPHEPLDPEKVAYWYFRLSGFLQIENFVVHPGRRGGQRTDADLLAIRFPHRAEFLFDHNEPMPDDVAALSLSHEMLDVVIAEVKTNQACTLNGPWTREDRKNVHRILAAIGCIPSGRISEAASDIYRTGIHQSDLGLRIRLVAIGRERNEELAASYPDVTQLFWPAMLGFIWGRFHIYRNQKTQVDQWDLHGRRLKQLADGSTDATQFIEKALGRMGVRSEV